MDLLPVDHLLKQVDGHDDLFAFRYDFTLSGKALDDGAPAETVTELENGDLLIEGYAAVFDGLDREGENFVDGAFKRGIKSFIGGQAALCHHHKHDTVIGKVTALDEHEGKGLWMQARVDKQETTSPFYHIYNGIRKGSIKGLSVGGFFKRAMVAGRKMIADVDFTEISTTGVPVHAGTSFAVVAGKALADNTDEIETVDFDFARLDNVLAQMSDIFGTLSAKALPSSHDPSAAHHVAQLLEHVQRTRSRATDSKEADHEDVKAAADELETTLAAHEAKLHKLAAKVGPLPHYNY